MIKFGVFSSSRIGDYPWFQRYTGNIGRYLCFQLFLIVQQAMQALIRLETFPLGFFQLQSFEFHQLFRYHFSYPEGEIAFYADFLYWLAVKFHFGWF